MNSLKMYQVSTLQALALGYTKSVITVEELLRHGDFGLGTFEGVNGEMIVLDGCCYQAAADGTVFEASAKEGVPFCAVSQMAEETHFQIGKTADIDALKSFLDVIIDERFELNSMHLVRIDACFSKVMARSETGKASHHVELKSLLENNQQDFCFNNIEGSLVCVYFPDFMDGINAAGWHLHFVSQDRTKGGHVFDVSFEKANAAINTINSIEIKLPDDAYFDTYALKEASNSDIKKVEQGNSRR